MSTAEERRYIAQLQKEIAADFERLAKEYQQERDLGALGEFANLYRKARKLKTLIWPGENRHEGEAWREDLRTIVKEVISHGLLLLVDLDRAEGLFQKWLEDDEETPQVWVHTTSGGGVGGAQQGVAASGGSEGGAPKKRHQFTPGALT